MTNQDHELWHAMTVCQCEHRIWEHKEYGGTGECRLCDCLEYTCSDNLS